MEFIFRKKKIEIFFVRFKYLVVFFFICEINQIIETVNIYSWSLPMEKRKREMQLHSTYRINKS